MHRSTVIFLMSFLLTAGLAGCQRSKTSAEKETVPDNPIGMMQRAMEGITGKDKAVETVDHRELRDILKENVRRGYDRTEYSSQSSGVMGFNISVAEATYDHKDGCRISSSIADTGGFGMAMMSMAAWSSLRIDKEDRHGYERTGTTLGNKSYERFDSHNQSSELVMIVEERFIVTLNGSSCSMDDLKKFAGDLDLNRLKRMI